ncbi:MAG: ATP phosphoribosyltransferase [Oscillospiraceae bacterium]|nr:ATP phosphoribosyltransferase [Oscillospiraceae bacterium]
MKIALTKGRLEKDAVALFEKAGMDVSALRDKGRRLILPFGDDLQAMLAKAPDVITYVVHGVCDLGIVGKDVIMEHGGRYFEVLDLGIGRCHFALAGKKGGDFYVGHGVKTVATKYTEVTRRYFESKGQNVDIIKIEGSVELAPLLNLADGIVDIVETGKTLEENGLEEYSHIADISARVIVNSVSMKLKKQRIEEFINRLGECVLCSKL